MKKLFLLTGLSMILLVGCGNQAEDQNTEETQNDRYIVINSQQVGMYGATTLQDKETGCQYILTTGSGTSVHPLVNADGKPLCKQ